MGSTSRIQARHIHEGRRQEVVTAYCMAWKEASKRREEEMY